MGNLVKIYVICPEVPSAMQAGRQAARQAGSQPASQAGKGPEKERQAGAGALAPLPFSATAGVGWCSTLHSPFVIVIGP